MHVRRSLPAKMMSAIEDHFGTARRRAPPAVSALRATAGPGPIRAAPVVLTRQGIPPLRRRDPVPPVPVHRAQVRTPLHVSPRQLLHVLFVQALLPLSLRHVQTEHVQEAHLDSAQDPGEHARTLHQAVRRHMLDYQKRTEHTPAESQRKQILLSLLDRIANALLEKNSTVIY